MMMPLATATLAPETLNPFSVNPLATLLASLVDFGRVRACEELGLFVSATNVRTGKGRIFRREELDVAQVAASACIPQVFAPVRIDGESYWDGSFVGNPAVGPLVDETEALDIVIVQNAPIARRDLPQSMADVISRANEIAFNLTLVREIGALEHLPGVVDEEGGATAHYGSVRLHLISGGGMLRDLSISSKFNTHWAFIRQLRELGQVAAQGWLDAHFDQVGVLSTLDRTQIYGAEEAADLSS